MRDRLITGATHLGHLRSKPEEKPHGLSSLC